jgi:UDP-N-acetylglucosamine 2-epimerase (non-hydrolysing)
LIVVAGTRPNFVKIAPIVHELQRHDDTFSWWLVHTGQHYDTVMSGVFFDELRIPRPDIDLGAGSGSHAQQTAAIMSAFEPVLLEYQPNMVVVVGDVNSTLACALVAAKLGVRVAHVEAGLRSFDRSMPEEINRILTDQLSDLLFVTEESGLANLRREGRPEASIHLVGNVMIDTLRAHQGTAVQANVPARLGLDDGGFALLTLHRPSNVDEPAVFERILQGLEVIARDVPIVFPVHPRTRSVVARSPRAVRLIGHNMLRLTEPLGYFDFLGLMSASRAVLTDSGGIQEETTVLGVPCLTLRDNTERPATVTFGTNRLVGTEPAAIIAAWQQTRRGTSATAIPPLWDGLAAQRIVSVLCNEVAMRGVTV